MSIGAVPAPPLKRESTAEAALEIDVDGRWDALALSELLIPFHSFLVHHTAERWVVHIGDPQVYRVKEELKKLQETRDPIRNLRGRLALAAEEWGALDAHAQRVVDAAVEFAQAGTDPSPSDALKYVYAEP